MGLARFIVSRLLRLRNAPVKLTRDGQPLSKQEIGLLGENLAVRYLRARGWKILYRNFRATDGGEVDIVARDGDVLAFIEVKSRTSERYGRPVDAVNMDKRFLITRGAMQWLRLLDSDDVSLNYRFDVVELILNDGKKEQINLIKGAFETPEPYLSG